MKNGSFAFLGHSLKFLPAPKEAELSTLGNSGAVGDGLCGERNASRLSRKKLTAVVGERACFFACHTLEATGKGAHVFLSSAPDCIAWSR